MEIPTFQKTIFDWYKTRKRDYLPWRPRKKTQIFNPYNVLVSEIMLQQTQVSRALVKYPEFLRAFPTIHTLARASLSEVLAVWQGMGYNRRAKYLRQAAQEIVARFKGEVPSDPEDLLSLSGIGSYTAGAIACFAYNKPAVCIDTNIRKVIIHFFFAHLKEVSDIQVKEIAAKALYTNNPRDWHYALMDYGALELARKPLLLQKAKGYRPQANFLGSPRYFRAKVVKFLLTQKKANYSRVIQHIANDRFFKPDIKSAHILQKLADDGMIVKDKKGNYIISH